MSSDNVRVRVRVGANEAEIEGPKDFIRDLVDLIPVIEGKLAPSLPQAQQLPPPQIVATGYPQTQQAPLQGLPELRVDKGESLPSIMTKLFGTQWGRTPRRLLEVKGGLESYGLAYPRQSVAVALLRLAQEGKLRRFKGADGDFLYTSSTSLLLGSPGAQQAYPDESSLPSSSL